MNTRPAKPEHQVAYDDLAALLRRHADKLTAEELLAVAANMLGKMIALQDQRTMTPDQAMEIVLHNLEIGNQQVLDQIGAAEGSA